MSEIRTLAITGATGFEGSTTLDAALERGYEVRALRRRDQPGRDGVTRVKGTLNDASALAELGRGADAMLHIAGLTNTPDPAEFVARQSAAWDPWIEWAAKRGIVLETTDSIRAIDQSEDSLNAVAKYAQSLPDFSLVLFLHLTAVYGSAILAMAVMEQALPPGEAFDLSRIDEIYRAGIWGTDEEDEVVRTTEHLIAETKQSV